MTSHLQAHLLSHGIEELMTSRDPHKSELISLLLEEEVFDGATQKIELESE